jgi:hypothetical protein
VKRNAYTLGPPILWLFFRSNAAGFYPLGFPYRVQCVAPTLAGYLGQYQTGNGPFGKELGGAIQRGLSDLQAVGPLSAPLP